MQFQEQPQAAGVIHILQKNNLNHLANQSDLYLYGHRSLTSVDNRKLLLSTIKYIKDTQYFYNLRLAYPPPPPPPPYLSIYICEFCGNHFHFISVNYCCKFLELTVVLAKSPCQATALLIF